MDRSLTRILAGGGLFVVASAIENLWGVAWLQIAFFMSSYIVVGGAVIWRAAEPLLKGTLFH